MRPAGIVLAVLLCGAGCTRSDGGSETAPHAAGRFTTVSKHAVRDARTGLVWTNHDNERNLAWTEADSYCRELALDGHSDWRLPEIDELEALYDEGESSSCGEHTCRLDPAITLTDPYVWSGTERGSGRRLYVDFKFGTRLAPLIRPRLVRRVLCIRGNFREQP